MTKLIINNIKEDDKIMEILDNEGYDWEIKEDE